MAKHANPTLVGAFVVGALALTVGGVITFGSGGFFTEEYDFVAYFEDSVSGLNVGAPIRYKGVEVGTVSNISASWNLDDDALRIPVVLTLVRDKTRARQEVRDKYPDAGALMNHLIEERGLKAILIQDSFVTGKLYVGLDFLPEEPLRLFGDGTLPEIPTTEAGMAKIKKSLAELPIKELLDEIIETVNAVENRVNSPEIDQLLASINKLMTDLDSQIVPLTETVQGTMGEASSLMKDTNARMDGTFAKLDQLVADLDAQVVPLSESLEGTMGDARGLMRNASEEVDALSASTQATMTEAQATLAEGQQLLANLNESFGQEYLPYRLAHLMEELADAARAIRALADQLERHPEALISGKDK